MSKSKSAPNKGKNSEKNLKKIKAKKFVKENMVLFIVLALILGIGLITMLISIGSQDGGEASSVYGDDKIVMHYFHLRTCPHCQKQNEYLPQLQAQYPNLQVKRYEMTNPSSVQKYKEMAKDYEGLDPNQFPGTPLTIVGDEFNVGFGTAATTGPKLESMVETVQQEIDANWNESTMVRTIELRKQQLQNE